MCKNYWAALYETRCGSMKQNDFQKIYWKIIHNCFQRINITTVYEIGQHQMKLGKKLNFFDLCRYLLSAVKFYIRILYAP